MTIDKLIRERPMSDADRVRRWAAEAALMADRRPSNSPRGGELIYLSRRFELLAAALEREENPPRRFVPTTPQAADEDDFARGLEDEE